MLHLLLDCEKKKINKKWLESAQISNDTTFKYLIMNTSLSIWSVVINAEPHKLWATIDDWLAIKIDGAIYLIRIFSS